MRSLSIPARQFALKLLLAAILCTAIAVFVVSCATAAGDARDTPALSAEVERLQAEIEELKERVNSLERMIKGLRATRHMRRGRSPDVSEADQAPTPRSAPRVAEDYDGPIVCREGCPYDDLKQAIREARPGDTITVAPELIGGCGSIQQPGVKLIGLKGPNGERPHLGGGACWGKGAIIVTASNVLIEGFEISNVSVPDKNGACIRVDPSASDLVIRDIYCHDSQNGILGGPRSGSLTIEDSTFERNGFDKGHSHGIYINKGDVFTLRNSRIISTKEHGHSLKTGARRSVIENNIIAALETNNSRAIDAYGGGELVIRGNVIQQSVKSDNHEAIGIALESRRLNPEPHSTVIENNWIIFDDLSRCCRWLLNAKQFGPFEINNNRIVGMTEVHVPALEEEVRATNTFFENRAAAGLPPYDGTVASLPTPGS